jgi:hypothetical protein
MLNVALMNVVDMENGVNEPERIDELAVLVAPELPYMNGELGGCLIVQVKWKYELQTVWTTIVPYSAGMTLYDLVTNTDLDAIPTSCGDTIQFEMCVKVPECCDNRIQSDSVTFDLVFELSQNVCLDDECPGCTPR